MSNMPDLFSGNCFGFFLLEVWTIYNKAFQPTMTGEVISCKNLGHGRLFSLQKKSGFKILLKQWQAISHQG